MPYGDFTLAFAVALLGVKLDQCRFFKCLISFVLTKYAVLTYGHHNYSLKKINFLIKCSFDHK